MISTEFKILHDDLKKYKWISGWEDFEGNVFLWRRDQDGKRVIVKVPDVPKYFVINSSDFSKTEKWPHWKAAGFYTEGKRRGKYSYIYIPPTLRRSVYYSWLTDLDDMGITPLEGDVSRLQRLMIEMNLQIVSPSDDCGPRWTFYDIETDDRSSEIVIGAERIVSVAFKDGQTGEEKFFKLGNMSDEAEKVFLKNVLRHAIQYDALIGYNNVGFDDQYLKARLEYLKIDTELWRRVAKFDMFVLLERQHTFAKYDSKDRKLDTISKAVLGRGKVEHSEGIYELWENNQALLEEYNLEDVRLIFDLEAKLKTVRLVLEVLAISGSPYASGYSPYRAIDMLLLRIAQNNRQRGLQDFRYPTGYYRPEHNIGSRYNQSDSSADKRAGRSSILMEEFGIEYSAVKGALVLDVIPGLHKNVFVADFNSLYPNTMRAFNIGWNTYLPEGKEAKRFCTAPNGARFDLDQIADMSQSVETLLNQRAITRAEMKGVDDPIILTALDVRQNALKELANSHYGVLALWGGRYFNVEIAEAVTSGGRTFLPFAVEFFGAKDGHAVIGGDTDSFFLMAPEDVTNVDKIVEDYLNALHRHIKEKYNCQRPEVLKMSVEKGFRTILFIKKKNYAGKLFMQDGKPIDKMVVKGLRIVKGNTSRWGAELAKRVVSDILDGYEKDHFEYLLSSERNKLTEGNVDYKKLIISARIGKQLDEYSSELVHVVIARRLMAANVFIPNHATINYIVTDGDHKLAGLEEQEIKFGESTFDVAYYWNHDLMPQIETVLDIVFPSVDWSKYRFPKNYKKNPFRCEAPIKKLEV